ncbi:MAG: lysophospholipid acyltransferase family protein [Actinomycetota bacterium]|nr:lysophospholipid acyltransferase family protein [Actinomycetota bacterium]MDK1017650.1 lysophospholipid acyltransferase family protein [Actinomycetota bacterium]MDK1027524.1 lysophospholipid acyltransferase family protein [Actinomycetota bacterium]MDK1038679.1 lysophospholipid acyltransferase family protein [Actinomycetota bacterium]MDK1096372.1 lysophospholipid acyltransferase family protein [Actinomycetota bacterium]
MLRTLVAGVRTFILVPLFLLLTLVAALTIIVYGAFRPASSVHDKILTGWSRVWLRIPPMRVEVLGADKIDPSQRYIVASNHLSMFDIPLLVRYLPLRGRFLAKEEVFKIPFVAHAMRTIGIIEINRKQGGSSRQAINEGVQIAADRGYSLLIFPEGARSDGSALLPFKKGAFRIAIDTGLPLLPVVIEGTERVSAPGAKVFFPGNASIRILDPIETAGMTNKDNLRELAARVESKMNTVYNDVRHETQD